MWTSQIIIPLLILGVFQVSAYRGRNRGLCIQPEVENGAVNIISESGSVLVANVTCNNEYQLVGKKVIKCSRGVWSSKAPICTRMGGCEVRDLPMVENSRRILVKPFRGNVVKYKCRTHYRLFGQNMFHCADEGKWAGGEPPICTRPGCDETLVQQIPYGTTKKMMKGALYQFSCDEGAVLSGSPSMFCDGKSWNDTVPSCLSPPGEPSLKLRVDDEPFGRMEELAVLRAGQTVSLRCTAQGGNPVPSLTFTKNGETFGPEPKAYQNTFNFVATPEDNGAVFGCAAQNRADWRAESKTVRLNVLFPPERLTIEGADELTSDYNARFTCKASASNLPSKLTFKLTSHHNDRLEEFVNEGLVEIEEHKEKWIENEQNNQGAPGWASTRTLVLKTDLLKKAAELGELITFECQIPDPYHERRILISATKSVTLYNPIPMEPLKLEVSGPHEIKINEAAQFNCDSNREDIEFTMTLDKKQKQTAFNTAKLILKPGDIAHGTNQFEIECFGIDENNDKVTISHIVNVLYPPSIVEITDKALRVGKEEKLRCEAKAGNPTAKMNWYKDQEMIESIYTVEGDMVKAEVNFVAEKEDEGKELRCEATNSAKTVSQTLKIELLPESSLPTESNVPHEDYPNYDELDKNYISSEYYEDDDVYSPPQIQTDVFGIPREVPEEPKRPVPEEPKRPEFTPEKKPVSGGTNKQSVSQVYPAVPLQSSSPATLSLSFTCLILAFLLHH